METNWRHDEKYNAPETPEGSIGDEITGKKEMAFIRNRYQKELDKDNSDIVHRVWDLQRIIKEIHDSKNDAERLKQNVEKHLEERGRVYTNLQNILAKEAGYEDKMLGKTLKGMKAKGRVTVKQKMKDVDIDTLQYGSVEQYRRLYPHYGEEVFKNVKEFKDKEREIRETQESYNQAVKRYNTLLENINLDMQKAEDNFSKYEKTKIEGERELKSCRYYGSLLYKLSSKKTKIELDLDVLKHNTEKFRHTLDMIKGELSTYKTKPLEPMKY
jgi:hypothetical protein